MAQGTKRTRDSNGSGLLLLPLILCAGGLRAQGGGNEEPPSSATRPAGEPRTLVLARFGVRNPSPRPRLELLRASVPFAEGRVRKLDDLRVQGFPTAWRALTRWPDGSVQWAQAQFFCRLGPLEQRGFAVVPKEPGESPGRLPERCAPGPRLLRILVGGVLETEVEDPFGAIYRCRIGPDGRDGTFETLVATPYLQVWRFHGWHRPIPGTGQKTEEGARGLGRDFLSVTAYLSLEHGMEHARLLLILGNDYLGADDPAGRDDPNLRPLGTVRLRRFSLRVRTKELAFVPRFIRENALKPPIEEKEGFRQDLLGPGEGIYLGDASCKGFPFVLFAPEGGPRKAPASPLELLRRQTAQAMAELPLRPMPDLSDVRKSLALNAHGGPAPLADAKQRALAAYARWRDTKHFGPFGTWGDTPHSATTGTPRNRTIGLDLAVRAQSPELMLVAEGFCLQQLLRPYHLWKLRVEPEDDIYLEGLPKYNGGWISAETLGRSKLPPETERYRKGLKLPWNGPYGMNAFDFEHFTVDKLYDYYCLTGEAWVREELRMLGEQLMALLRPRKYFWSRAGSPRGEGWCLKALVLCWLATGDDRLKRHAIDRLVRIQDKGRGKPPNAYAARQGPHPLAFGKGVYWDAPWQEAAYVMGMHAGWRYFRHPLFRTIAIDVAGYMARQGWVEGVGPKYFVDVDDPSRYKLPQGYGPLGGTAEFENPAFVLAAELAREVGKDEEARLFMRRANTILNAHKRRGFAALCANKWFQIHLDRIFPR